MFLITKDYAFTKQLTENLRKHYESNKRLEGEPVHVSGLVSSSCIRKQVPSSQIYVLQSLSIIIPYFVTKPKVTLTI